MMKTAELKLTQEWDKTFPKSDKVDYSKVTFINRYGITLAADMYVPKNAEGKLPTIAVCDPFGAVKEQCSGLYAQTMAERGFLTIAFDPSFTGESGGEPRYMASPDINTEDFQAAVDFLSNCDKVNPERIGIIGICGWGGMALNVAALDTRIKATVASTMYDMTRVNANGYFDSEDNEEKRYEHKFALNNLRTAEYAKGEYSRSGGCVELPVPDDIPFFVKDYSEYYRGQSLSQAFTQFQRGLEHRWLSFLYESADSEIQQRDTLRSSCDTRRKSTLLLFQQGHVQGYDNRQQVYR